jgi:hypothetical protein
MTSAFYPVNVIIGHLAIYLLKLQDRLWVDKSRFSSIYDVDRVIPQGWFFDIKIDEVNELFAESGYV